MFIDPYMRLSCRPIRTHLWIAGIVLLYFLFTAQKAANSTPVGIYDLKYKLKHLMQLKHHEGDTDSQHVQHPQTVMPAHQQWSEKLWAGLQPLLESCAPKGPVVKAQDPIDFTAFDPSAVDWTEDLLQLETQNVVRMRNAHRQFVRQMKQTFPLYIQPRNSARRGIVVTVSKEYFPVLVVSLRMLQWTKTTLPVEIWFGKREDYEEIACEKIASSMNAKCFVIEDVLMHDGGKFKPTKKFVKFEYKVLAILFSSFREVMYFDADAFPLHPPEELFENDPYRRTGMILWPDIWREAVSPTYYLVNDQQPHHRGVRAATESGQMMFDKATHIQTLLLAAYYNYHGESHYYSLLSQNGPGRGDKDTFIAAAETLGVNFWQVREPVASLGHDFGGSLGNWVLALIQWDPAQDFHRYRYEETGNVFNNTLPRHMPEHDSFDDSEPPRMFFLHCNSRKWNPKDVLDFIGGYDLAWDLEGKPMRAYTDPPDIAERLGYTERVIWDEVKWTACDSEIDFKNWEGKASQICDMITRYFFTNVDPTEGVEPLVPTVDEAFVQWFKEEKKKTLYTSATEQDEEHNEKLAPDDTSEKTELIDK